MSNDKARFSVATKTAKGEPAVTEVRLDLAEKATTADRLEEIIREAKRNIASRVVDFDDFQSDSSYLDALDAATEKVTVVDVTTDNSDTHFFCRARVSDLDRRIFVRNIAAPRSEIAEIIMAWELSKLLSITAEEALLDFIGSVEIETPSQIPSADTINVSYVVSTPKGDDVLVEAVRPAKSRMIDDVAEIFLLAAVSDPTINPEQFTSIQKSGATARYFIEANYRDGDDYRDWVHATDEEEAEFHAACAVEANQTGNADEPVIESLGDFIEGVDETEVTVCHLDPVTRDELLQAVRKAISAYDARVGQDLDVAMSTLRDMAQSMSV